MINVKGGCRKWMIFIMFVFIVGEIDVGLHERCKMEDVVNE